MDSVLTNQQYLIQTMRCPTNTYIYIKIIVCTEREGIVIKWLKEASELQGESFGLEGIIGECRF